jgi:hypothetical protein
VRRTFESERVSPNQQPIRQSRVSFSGSASHVLTASQNNEKIQYFCISGAEEQLKQK